MTNEDWEYIQEYARKAGATVTRGGDDWFNVEMTNIAAANRRAKGNR
jgi:hypothetical protein